MKRAKSISLSLILGPTLLLGALFYLTLGALCLLLLAGVIAVIVSGISSEPVATIIAILVFGTLFAVFRP